MSFGSEIGSITNRSTSMFDVLAKYEEGSPEYEELMYRIKCSIQYQQNSIDKSKGIVSKSMPIEWYRRKPNVVDEENDTEEEIKQKLFNQRILVDKKPYFFNYVYPSMMKDYKEYIVSSNRKALYQFNLTIEELLQMEKTNELTDEQREFMRYYHMLMPNNCNPCVMNKICWYIEAEFNGFIGKQNKNVPFDYSVLKSDKKYSPATYRRIHELYEIYVNIIERAKTLHKKYKKQSSEEHANELMKIRTNFKNEALKVCSNEEDLCNMMIDYCYSKGKSKKFVWGLLGEQIVENLLAKNENKYKVLVQSDEGEVTFKGLTFKEIEKQRGN